MSIKKQLRKNWAVYSTYIVLSEFVKKTQYRISKKRKTLYFNLMKNDYKKSVKREMRIPPVSYTEKIEYRKFYGITPEMSLLSDKYRVRDWVAGKIGKEYLIPLLGVWDNFDSIDFNELPKAFVLKTNNASGTNYIVKDKNLFDQRIAKRFFDFWIRRDFAFAGMGFEMQYSNIPPKIIAERYVEDPSGELTDYKFLCFNGKPYYCWVDIGRSSDHRRSVYDMNWKLQEWNQYTYKHTDYPVEKPKNFDKMVELVNILCNGFSHVRVDLYNVEGVIYFGEMTFTNGKGHEVIYPIEQNEYLGELWELKKENDDGTFYK